MRRHFRVVAASIIGLFLIAGAYAAPKVLGETVVYEDAGTQALREHQHSEDSDNDGIPDWNEQLAGSDLSPLELSIGSSTSKTATDQFAIDFFKSYLERENGAPLSAEDRTRLAAEGIAKLGELSKSFTFTETDISVSNETGFEHTREYGNAAGTAILKHHALPKGTKNELEILTEAITSDDEKILASLDPILQSYKGMVRELARVTVPTNLRNEHLALVNALQTIHDDIEGMKQAFNDPVQTVVRVKRYHSDVAALKRAVLKVRSALESAKVVYEAKEGGAFFFSIQP